ncbi:MAG: group II intron maturase-specific domain-containing protein, partial [Bacillota bacterium]|nr:group II intron maturase-specific domain-containing protein [Bacillota bacterium]
MEQLVIGLNRFLRGWIPYFQLANCKVTSGSHGMDPQKRLLENLHVSLAQFGQSSAESSSAQ